MYMYVAQTIWKQAILFLELNFAPSNLNLARLYHCFVKLIQNYFTWLRSKTMSHISILILYNNLNN